MKKTPYIGVTGFMSSQQIDMILANTDLENTPRLLMVGVLASSKTINGLPNNWPNRYPLAASIKDIFFKDPRCLNIVHYNTEDQKNLLAQMIKITEIAGPHMHGIQLNIAWPDPKVLRAYKKLFPKKVIILQVGINAFISAPKVPEILAQKIVSEYGDVIDYVLLDQSDGLGVPLKPCAMIEYLYALQELSDDPFSEFGVVVAGGLSPGTLNLLDSIAIMFPNVSTDAEGRLRSPQPEDELLVDVAVSYVQKSLDLFL